ncbi:hypothetical protein B0I35DRAFT_192662 [Stachybotrys elegans]|uniref:Uncharacterized protein n=1 Tax=Stachybotrys elegans TaxID=80388 RepID=A0A8K0WUD3_9HYPO|nr:hypothetical protein B0I35DRAFT_192662 [Stachybotrys elegans]
MGTLQKSVTQEKAAWGVICWPFVCLFLPALSRSSCLAHSSSIPSGVEEPSFRATPSEPLFFRTCSLFHTPPLHHTLLSAVATQTDNFPFPFPAGQGSCFQVIHFPTPWFSGLGTWGNGPEEELSVPARFTICRRWPLAAGPAGLVLGSGL